MKAIVNGRIVTPHEVIEGKALMFDQKIVGLVDPATVPADAEVVDARGLLVIPGLIDIHTHGYQGSDASDGDFEGLKAMAEGFARNGVTSFLPTTMTLGLDTLRTAFDQIRRAMRESAQDDWMGAQILGVNSEGPFINVARKGAQPGEYVIPADMAFLKENADVIRMFTVAPEVAQNMDAIREMTRDTDVCVSIGHTCATYEQAKAAFDAGARNVTHLFNAQTGLQHREPGVVGAALTDDRVYCELIADTFHVDKGLYPLVSKMKGDKLVVITDSLRAAGLAEGVYELGGQAFTLKGIECRLMDGTIAGSILTMNHGVRNLLDNTNLTISQAVRAGSLAPAECIGVAAKKGSIEVGKDADLAIVTDRFEVVQTLLGGRTIYRAED